MAAFPFPFDSSPFRKAVVVEACKWLNQVGGIKTVTRPNGMAYPELRGYEILIWIWKEAGQTPTTVVPCWSPEMIDGIRQGYWLRKAPVKEGNPPKVSYFTNLVSTLRSLSVKSMAGLRIAGARARYQARKVVRYQLIPVFDTVPVPA
ncbi:MAG: hypothetical protein LAQ69_13950 [Acidobacteriia bacterium]|nr:hypothetical protein [Terriglobia bacterium]